MATKKPKIISPRIRKRKPTEKPSIVEKLTKHFSKVNGYNYDTDYSIENVTEYNYTNHFFELTYAPYPRATFIPKSDFPKINKIFGKEPYSLYAKDKGVLVIKWATKILK